MSYLKLLVLLASTLLASTVAQAQELLWDNGEPQAIGYPNSIAHSSFSSWHLYDDFKLDEETVITSITFTVWHKSPTANVRARFILADEMIPKGKYAYQVGVPYRNPPTITTTSNGRKMYSYTTWYYGHDVTMSGLNITLPAGGYVLGVGTTNGTVLGGYSWKGGPDVARQPGLTCFRQRSGNGSRRDYCKGGHWAFKVYGKPVNTAPIADAGDDLDVRAGTTVSLDGTGSSDDQTASEDLDYAWTLESAPMGSTASLVGADTATPTLYADKSGTWRATLVVTDAGGLASEPDSVEITGNLAPTADAGEDQLVVIDDEVWIDGTGSSDPEDDALTFLWSMDRVPTGSTATLDDANAAETSFIADVEGTYALSLDVSDFVGAGIADETVITAVTAEEYASRRSAEARALVVALAMHEVTTRGNQTALLAYLDQVTDALAKAKIGKALDSLDRATERTDGCVLRGRVDRSGAGRDWVTDCAQQRAIHALLADAAAVLE